MKYFLFTIIFTFSSLAKTEKATFAGGCFWGVEEVFRKVPGVTETGVGYTGGTDKSPTYAKVATGKTGHAEAVEVIFDPKKISYEKLLNIFFTMHDPTTLNFQGHDTGTEYRSVIFYHTDTQKLTAEKFKAKVEKSNAWKKPIVTTIEPAGAFYEAEEDHQKYLLRNPKGYNNHYIRKLSFDVK